MIQRLGSISVYWRISASIFFSDNESFGDFSKFSVFSVISLSFKGCDFGACDVLRRSTGFFGNWGSPVLQKEGNSSKEKDSSASRVYTSPRSPFLG